MPQPRRKPGWTDDLETLLLDTVAELGSQWEQVAERLGRSADACRVHYNKQVRAGRWPQADNRRAADPGLVRQILALWETGMVGSAIAKRLQLTLHTVQYHIRQAQVRQQAGHRQPPKTFTVHAHWTPPASDSPAAVWQLAEQRTATDLTKHRTQHVADLVLPGQPVAVAVVSDQHIRLSGPVDLKRMREDAELIAQTDGLYAILGGDGVDNHIKHHAAMVHGGSAPNQEWQLFDHYLGLFQDKILAVVSGNHDDWTSDVSGVSKLKDLAEARRLFMAPDEVVLHLSVGDQPYTVLVRHQYRFNSQLNQVHTVKQLWNYGNTKFDIGVVCHHHTPAIEPFLRHGQVVWGARPGSYQYTSSYARRYGHASAFPTCPTFLLWPDSKRILGFMDVRDAADYLTYIRRG